MVLFCHVIEQKYHHHRHKERLHSPEQPVATAALKDTRKGKHEISTAILSSGLI
jgi:hypothetical protein